MKNSKKALYNWRAYLGLKTWQKFFISFFVFILLAFLLHFKFELSEILSASSFLFSIMVGFFIASAMSNFSRLKTLVSQETGGLIALYQLVNMIDANLGKKVAGAIETYIVSRFDWELENYVENTNKEFSAIFDVLKLKDVLPEDKKEENALYFVINSLANLPAVRREIGMVGKSTLNRLYWSLLISLSLVVIVSLYSSIGLEFSEKIMTVLLASVVVLVLIVLDDIDKNKMNEYDVAFTGYNEVLKAIEKPRYFLEIDLKAGRVKLPKNEPYRLGIYKNFPYSFEKEIKTIQPTGEIKK